MKTPLIAIVGLFGLSLAACASAPPPKPAAPVEVTAADMPSREAFTPPDQWEMKIADKPSSDASNKDIPASRVQADTASTKRPTGGLVTLPGKSAAPTK